MINKDCPKVAIIGAGYIGAVLSAVLASKGCEVRAIDINPDIINFLERGESPINEPGLSELIRENVDKGNLKASSDFSVVASVDTVLITVGTPLKEDGTANKTAIKNVVSSIKPFVKDNQLIILKSTVPPCTTENDISNELRKNANVYVAFCPERLAEGNAIKECLTIPVIVGGVDNESGLKAEIFWKNILGVKIIKMENARSAELVKLADNSWIDLNIALAFELAKLSDNLNIDVLPVIKAANSLPKGDNFVNILYPSVGVGGYCLTKDPLFLNAFAKSLGSEFKTAITSREINDESPIYAAKKLNLAIKREFHSENFTNIEIGILGLAFKNNTGDCRFTPTIGFIKYLSNIGYKLKIYDPYIDSKDYKLFDFKNVYVVNSIKEVVTDSSSLAFLTGHKEFHNIEMDFLKSNLVDGAIIFDGRMFFSNEKIKMIKNNGFVFEGIGR